MKKINRYINYFTYSGQDADFEIKAFNEQNKQIKIVIKETGDNHIDIKDYSLSLAGPHAGYVKGPLDIARVDQETVFIKLNILEWVDGPYVCTVKGKKPSKTNASGLSEITFDLGSETDVKEVRLGRAGLESTDDDVFWQAIKEKQLNFNTYFDFISNALYINDYPAGPGAIYSEDRRRKDKKRGAFVGVNEYNMLKYGTEYYMLKNSALDSTEISSYLGAGEKLPYYTHLSDAFNEIFDSYPTDVATNGDLKMIENRFKTPFIELIWSYWMEQGMLMQAMSLINLRFQNINTGPGNPLFRFDISPLRALSHILWGFIQDEQHRLSLPRRVQEYDHEYGLQLKGRAVPAFVPADSRSKFLEAFHSLLTTASIFYKEADDTTRIADAFPVLNSLKEVHLILAEGNHNAYGNLTWTARHEMLMTQYIIARDETKQFIGGRPMVPYPETWMDRVDTVRGIMGWGGTSITYFYDLAIHGEKILLGVRYGDWSDANIPVASAANWALAFRDSIQKYMHGYRTVTGIDLSADAPVNSAARNVQPAILIQRRVSEERTRQRRA